MDFKISRSVREHAFGLYTRPEDIYFVWIASWRIHVNVIRRFWSWDAGKVDVHFMRSFDDWFVRGRVGLTSVVVENQINLKIEVKKNNGFWKKSLRQLGLRSLPVQLFLWGFPQTRWLCLYRRKTFQRWNWFWLPQSVQRVRFRDHKRER